MEKNAVYIAEKLRAFLKKGERVLICLEDAPGSCGAVFREAVEHCGGIAVMWGEDKRWKSLLRLAFTHKVGTIVGAPGIILGLAKLARAKDTPLYVHNVVTTTYPCRDWMAEGIVNGLDCRIRDLDLPLLQDGWMEKHPEIELLRACREIMEWTSVLDCRLERGVGGLEIEIVVFPGEKLPKLPTCAKLTVRPWNPETDQPLFI